MNIDNIKSQFPIFNNKVQNNDLVYLDSANSSQKPKVVIDRIYDFYTKEFSNVGRSVHYLAVAATNLYENTRVSVQKYLNAKDKHEIVFTKGATEAINLVANTFSQKYLEGGDEVLLTELEHHSNYVPWHFLRKSKGINIEFAEVNNDGDVSFVAVRKEDFQFKESWKELGSLSNLLQDFSTYDSSIFPELKAEEPLYKWGIYVRPPLQSMTAKNITLVGDAAHPMVPFLGQGACMAIEDAYSFAMLCKYKNGNFIDAQKIYDLIRSKRTKKIQQASLLQGKIYHMKNPMMVLARNSIMKYTNIPGNDLKKIHDYDAHQEVLNFS